MRLSRGQIFFAAMCLSSILVINTVRPRQIAPNIKAVLTKQDGSIANIDTPRKASTTKNYLLDVVEFQNSNTLIHKTMGPLGFTNDFFIDFEAELEVLEAGMYTFNVASDDGFRLWVDDKQLAEWLGDRPVATTPGKIALDKGRHKLRLSYFQGYGNLGLKVTYNKEGSSSYRLGESSAQLEFIPYPR